MGININTKILLSLASIAAAGALVVGATFAFFSDSETSTGNTFKAGTLDLKVDSSCHYFQNEIDVGCGQGAEFGNWLQSDLTPGVHKFFNFNDIKPGDRGEDTVSLHVVDNDAWGRFVIKDVAASPDDDLRQALQFSVWLDQGTTKGFQCGSTPACDADPQEGDNVQQEQGEPTLITPGTVDAGGETHNIYDGLAGVYTAESCTGDGVTIPLSCPGIAPDGRMIGSTSYYFGIAWKLPADTGNQVQGDSLSATMEFQAVQSRNNPSKNGF